MKEQEVYDAWKSGVYKLALDDLLVNIGVTHFKFRRWLTKNKHELYSLTPGLAQEVFVCSLDHPLSYTQGVYQITRAELHRSVYGSVKDGAIDLQGLKNDLLNNKFTQATLATKYDITQARVSQVKKMMGLGRKRRVRKPLTEDEIQDILASDKNREEICKQYNISKTTYYKVIKP